MIVSSEMCQCLVCHKDILVEIKVEGEMKNWTSPDSKLSLSGRLVQGWCGPRAPEIIVTINHIFDVGIIVIIQDGTRGRIRGSFHPQIVIWICFVPEAE